MDPTELHRMVGVSPPTLRRGDIASASGVDPMRSIRWWRAMGFPEVADDTVAFNPVDLEIVQRLAELEASGLIDDDDVLRLARLIGASMQRIAEAQLEVVTEPDPVLMKLLEQSVIFVWRRHMLAAMGRRFGPDDDTADDTDELAVGFSDLAGFTKLSKTLTQGELTELIDQFEATAFDVVSGLEGRVVKLIGDEVMFVAPTLGDAARIGLELGRRLGELEIMPQVQCGIAVGPTVSVGGDVFGTTVNLASRLTTIARKGTVVVPRDAIDLLADDTDLVVRPLRRNYSLKGLGDTRIAVVDRAPEVEP